MELLEVSRDKLHLSFANHTVTFTTPAVTRIVKELVRSIDQSANVADLIAGAAEQTGEDPGLAAYVFEMLQSTHCLYWPDTEVVQQPDALSDYFASTGEDPGPARMRLQAARPVILACEAGCRALEEALSDSAIHGRLIPVSPGTPVAQAVAEAQSRIDEQGPIVSWGFAYRSAIAAALNEAAMLGVPALFGACEGLIGRIGPYVIPRSTACLVCFNSRLLSHAGSEELSCFTARRLHSDEIAGAAPPTHPAFLKAIAALFVLELTQILLKRPPRTLGGVLEHSLTEGSAVRRTVLKAPHCPACRRAVPPRFAWNATFTSPTVKENSG